MQKKKSVKINFILNSLRVLMNMIFPLLSFPYAAKVLLPEGIGIVSYAQSVVSYFLLFAMLGIPTYGIRACAKVRENKRQLSKTVKEIWVINNITMFLTYIVYFIAILTIKEFSNNIMLYLITGLTILFNVIGLEWLFQALEEYAYITIRSFVFKLICIVLLFIFVKDSDDYVNYALISVLSSYGSNVLNLFFARKFLDFSVKIDYSGLFKHFKPILNLFAITAAASVYSNLDTIMLGKMTSNVEVGYYTTAIKIKTIVLTIVNSLSTVLLPRTSYYLANGLIREYNAAINKALNFVKILSFPLVIFFVIFAKSSIILISSESYIPAVSSMRLIMPTVIVSGFSSIIGMQIYVSRGKENIVMKSAICGAVSDIILNYILIKFYAAAGASLATTITEIIVLCMELYMGRDIIKHCNIRIKILKPLLALVLPSVMCVLFLIFFQFDPFFTLLIGGLLFFASYYLQLLLFKDEIVLEMIHIFQKTINVR